ncbi:MULTISPECIES: NnrS family protein [unclassified Hydrogenophaga]|uniref:NnrS family protein n=1 Tax=unclassified Hydrogenophaga TaxID=2610897 RepID=UPI001F2FACD1|nr:NnrS family protein [Hydrogenophaga sp. Root209]
MSTVARARGLPSGGGEPPEPRPWRARHLLLAPHRLGFALAMVLLLASGIWWALVQVDRASGLLGLPYAFSPSVGHAAVMTFGFIPLFFSGFLFTAGPKWLRVAPPSARELLTPLLLQELGWLLWLAGVHTRGWLALVGAAAACLGLGWVVLRFWLLLRRSIEPDRLHACTVGVAGLVGVASLVLMTGALWVDENELANAAVSTALWGFVVMTYIAVAHRMIPFFTSDAVPMLHAWRPFWVLWVLLLAVAIEVLSVWIPWVVTESSARGWLLVRGLVELAAGGVVLWLAAVWGLAQSLKIRLLAMLHLGFLWLGLAFVLSGVSHLWNWGTGTAVLGLAPIHALSMGCLGSLMLAMVTRVSCGHSGRALVADRLIWTLFWLLQLAVLLRIAAALKPSSAWLITLAAVVWAGVIGVWALRLLDWYGRVRSDGRAG